MSLEIMKTSLCCSVHSETVEGGRLSGVDDSSGGVSDSSRVEDYSGVIDGLYAQLERYKTSMQVCVCVCVRACVIMV